MPRIHTPRRDLDPRAPYARQLNTILHAPDPVIGWTGDPDLFMAWNRLQARWEVWRTEDEGDRLIAKAPSGERLDMSILLQGLVKRDLTLRTNSAIEQMERVIRENEAADAARTDQAVERLSETMEKVYHAAVHKSGEYGYVAPVSLSGAWKDA